MDNTAIRSVDELLANGEGKAAYIRVFGDWGRHLNAYVPPYMHNALVYYILRGKHPGDFLTSFLKSDLFEAMGNADDMNCHRFHSYCIFLHNYAPNNCFGSSEIFRDWIKSGGVLGQQESVDTPEESHSAL